MTTKPQSPPLPNAMPPRQRLTRWAKEITHVRQIALDAWSDMLLLVGGRTSAASIAAPTLSTYVTAMDYADDYESGVFLDEDYNKASRVDFITQLPFELLLVTLSHLDLADIGQCMLVCRDWHRILRSECTWKFMLGQRFQGLQKSPQLQKPLGLMNAYDLYRNQHTLNANWETPSYTATTLEGHSDSVYCSQMLSDGRHVLTGSRDTTARVWDIASSECVQVLAVHSGSVLCVACDAGVLVSGSSDATCAVFDLPSYQLKYTLRGHDAGVLDVQVNAEFVFSCSKDRSIMAWSRATGEPVWKVENAHESAVNALSISQDELFSAGGDGVIRQWCARTGAMVRKFRGHTRGLACLRVDKPGNRIISGGNDRVIRVWNLNTGECCMTLAGHTSLIRSLHIVGDMIVSASYDRTIRVWDARGQCLAVHNGLHGSWIFSVCGTHKWIVSTSIGAKPVILDFCGGLDPDFEQYL